MGGHRAGAIYKLRVIPKSYFRAILSISISKTADLLLLMPQPRKVVLTDNIIEH